MTASTSDLRSHSHIKRRRGVLEPSITGKIQRHPRMEAKRERIVNTAMQHFAEQDITPLGSRIFPRSWAWPRVLSFNILAARADCFWKLTKKRCALFRPIWIRRRRFGSEGFLKFCVIGC